LNRFVYTDASFSHKYQIAILGFYVFKSDVEHQAGEIAPADIQLTQIGEKNNIRAELKSALAGLRSLAASADGLTLFTDCSTLVNLPRRRLKLQGSNYQSRRKKSTLANADLYELLFHEFSRLHPTIYWIKGHSSRAERSFMQENFSQIDRLVREKLREAVALSSLSESTPGRQAPTQAVVVARKN
jgi:ribonuclease HI